MELALLNIKWHFSDFSPNIIDFTDAGDGPAQ